MIIKTSSRVSLELLLDLEDHCKANTYTWYNKISKDRITIYTYINDKPVSINKLIFNVKNNELVYHINGNKCDFTRDNIRILNRKEYGHLIGGKQKIKSSKYHGVYYCNTTNKWWVRVNKEEKPSSEHSYNEEIEAAIVADYISIQKYGDKANRNFPNLSLEELSDKFKLIKEKYGYTNSEIKSKSMQGVSRAKNKASRYIGVTKSNRTKKPWVARIKYQGKSIHLGNHQNEINAAKAYDQAAIEIYGEYAKTNF